MPHLSPLPPPLARAPFSVADARRHGVRESRLRGRDLVRPFHGVRRGHPAPDGIRGRCLDYLPRMREGQFFSHLTAAELWGIPLPSRVRPTDALDVAAVRPARAPRTQGVVTHDLSADRVEVRDLDGLPLADPLSTWVQLRSFVGPRFLFGDLVAAGDAIVLRRPRKDRTLEPALASLDDLRQAAADAPRRGSVLLRSAAEAVREGAESRPETLLRLLLVGAGLPEPLVNADVYDDGWFLARGDLVYPTARVIVEYDGDDHRKSKERYEHDQQRIDALREAGWLVIRIRAEALFLDPESVIRRVRRALARVDG